MDNPLAAITCCLKSLQLSIAKGQIKPKADLRTVDSPKKQTKEFVLCAVLPIFSLLSSTY